jgi:hypothetical protein
MPRKSQRFQGKHGSRVVETDVSVDESDSASSLTPLGCTPDSLSSFPSFGPSSSESGARRRPHRRSSTASSLSSSTSDLVFEPSDTNNDGADAMSQLTREHRKQVHLECEHRRRAQISEALRTLQEALPEDYPSHSKMAILSSTCQWIADLEERRSALNRKQLELAMPSYGISPPIMTNHNHPHHLSRDINDYSSQSKSRPECEQAISNVFFQDQDE